MVLTTDYVKILCVFFGKAFSLGKAMFACTNFLPVSSSVGIVGKNARYVPGTGGVTVKPRDEFRSKFFQEFWASLHYLFLSFSACRGEGGAGTGYPSPFPHLTVSPPTRSTYVFDAFFSPRKAEGKERTN